MTTPKTALGVTEGDREFAVQILADFGAFEEGITDQEKLAQWVRNIRRAAQRCDVQNVDEHIAQLQYEAGMYRSLYENAIVSPVPSADRRGRPHPEVVAAVQQALMKHPHFEGGPAMAFGFANTAIDAYRVAVSSTHRGSES